MRISNNFATKAIRKVEAGLLSLAVIASPTTKTLAKDTIELSTKTKITSETNISNKSMDLFQNITETIRPKKILLNAESDSMPELKMAGGIIESRYGNAVVPIKEINWGRIYYVKDKSILGTPEQVQYIKKAFIMEDYKSIEGKSQLYFRLDYYPQERVTPNNMPYTAYVTEYKGSDFGDMVEENDLMTIGYKTCSVRSFQYFKKTGRGILENCIMKDNVEYNQKYYKINFKTNEFIPVSEAEYYKESHSMFRTSFYDYLDAIDKE